MGRYYSGDIEGKFWFGIQSSTAAQRFGGTEIEPNFIIYHFNEGDLKQIASELKLIKETLGNKLEILDKFFEENSCYSDNKLKTMGISRNDLSKYADFLLGTKIFNCVKEKGFCKFEAEL